MEHIAILRPNLPNFGSRSAIFIFGTNFSWNEGIDTCFNVKYVLLGRNFDFFWWLARVYCSLPGGYCLLLVVTARYRWLMLVLTFMNGTVMYLSKCRRDFEHSCDQVTFSMPLSKKITITVTDVVRIQVSFLTVGSKQK